MKDNERKYCVYKHTSPSDKVYIGITSKEPEERWGKNGYRYKNNRHFWNAIQKYGWDNIKHEILFENLTKKEACEIEIELIASFNTQNQEFGYNISPGGDLGFTGCHLSLESRRKISKANKGRLTGENNPMFGITPKERMDKDTYLEWKDKLVQFNTSDESRQNRRNKNIGKKYSDEINKKKGRSGSEHHMYGKHHSEETKEKIRQANIGRVQSDETRKKISDAMIGENNPFYGKTHTDETRKKISEANKGKPGWNKGVPMSDEQKAKLSAARTGVRLSKETRKKMSESKTGVKNSKARKIAQYDTNENFLRTWDYIKQAADELNINRCSISECCRGGQKTAGGFIWKYIEEVM